MKNFIIKKSIFAVGVIVALRACNSYSPKGQNQPVAVSSVELSHPSFATVQTAVFQARCYECHTAATGNRGGVNLETYASVVENIEAIQDEVLVKGSMPPKSRGPLSDDEKQLLANWISTGTPEVAKPAAP